MNTISFDEPLEISKSHFKSIEEFQLFLVEELQKSELSNNHKEILDDRLLEANENSEDYISLKKLKSSIKRK